MKHVSTALALLFGAAVTTASASAFGQAAQAQAAPAVKPSAAAQNALAALQQAVNANDAANIPARLAAAQAAVKTADDRYILGMLQLKAAAAAKDNAGVAAAIESVLASGKVEASELPKFYSELAKAYTAANQPARATAAVQRLVELQPNNLETRLLLAQSYKAQGRAADAVAELQKGIAAAKAAGTKPDERLYRHAVQIAYDSKLPSALEIARSWVEAYPSPDSWRNTLAIYQNVARPDESVAIDLLRLKRALGLLAGRDYETLAALAVLRGFPGEAKAVLDEGFAANQVQRTASVNEIYTQASAKSAGDKAALEASAKTVGSGAAARPIVAAADAFYGYGDYAKAAGLYRAALGKQGADRDLINLRLGMALARSGDKTGATTALQAVSGPRAELAKIWLAYLRTRA